LNKFEVLLQKLLRFLEGGKLFQIVLSESGDLDLLPSKKEHGKENCRLLLGYLLEHKEELFSKKISLREFDLVRTLVDYCYLYRKKVDKQGEFENLALSLRLGGNIPVDWLKEHPKFKKFIKNNYLHHRLFVLRLPLPFDKKKGAALPFRENDKTTWIYWSEIREEDYDFYLGKRVLFETDNQYRLIPSYTCLYLGICHYDVSIDPKWEPFQVIDPKDWGNKHILEVWTVSLPMSKPPMFQRTHAYLVLKDDQGNVRSVGQDVLVDRANYRITEILNRKSGFGKITTPDIYTFYPINARRFWHITLEITEEEHDRIVRIVEKDKVNKEHSMSVLKGNCVSYVLKILKEGIGIQMDASMHGLHIMLKAFMPNSWYRAFFKRFDPWYEGLSDFTKKALYFLPIIYIPSFLLGVAALFTRQNNYQEIRDFSFLDLIIRPWKLSCEHPLALHRKLDAIQDIIPLLRSLYSNL
jgi:hypothetical protein